MSLLKMRKKNNIELNQDINIKKPDKNILKIEDVIKNDKIPQKFNFRKNKTSTQEVTKTSPSYHNNNKISNFKANEINADDYISKYKNYEIKEQRVNINFLGDNDKLRIIPLKKKIMLNSKSQNSLFSNSNNNINDNINNSNINDNKQGNTEKKNQHIIILQKSKNLYSKKKY